MQRKTLLAIAFAAAMLNAQSTAFCGDKAESTDSLIQGISDNTQLTPEIRAYFLLSLARRYLTGCDRDVAEAQFSGVAIRTDRVYPSSSFLPRILASWQKRFVSLANDVSVEERTSAHQRNANKESTSDSRSKSNQAFILAEEATNKALSQLDNSSDRFATLDLYFTASRLFEQTGDTPGSKKCVEILNALFHSCEEESLPDEEGIKAASSVLNSMAYGLVPIQIPDFQNERKTAVPPFSDADFKESEKLKLRAVAMADRLPATDDIRRRVHRDLVLWYMQLGKADKAEKEKQVLFGLVGCKDDSILYPQSVGCGHVVWWKPGKSTFSGGCGMG